VIGYPLQLQVNGVVGASHKKEVLDCVILLLYIEEASGISWWTSQAANDVRFPSF